MEGLGLTLEGTSARISDYFGRHREQRPGNGPPYTALITAVSSAAWTFSLTTS